MPSACLTAVTYGPSCRVHDRAGDAGEPDEAITHYSFNGGAYDCCRSIAHDSRQRLGLGLAGRLGMGSCSRSGRGWRNSLSVLRLWLRLPRLWLRLRSSLWRGQLRLWLPVLWL